MLKIGLLVVEPVAAEIPRPVLRHLHVHGAEHVVQRVSRVQFFQPGFGAREEIALKPEAHVDPTRELGPGRRDERHVVFKLLRRHAHGGRDAIGQWAVAGEDDPL